MKVGIVLLAAGGSRRLGRPKQLLRFKDGTLLSHAVHQAANSRAVNVVIVLGPHQDECRKELTATETSNQKVCAITNIDWQDGIAFSIRAGVSKFSEDDTIDAALIMTCDQPHVMSEHLDKLIDAFAENQSLLIATSYQNSFGIPALFGRTHFHALCNLRGDSGAKVILQQHEASLVRIPLEEALHDIDTEDDYNRLLDNQTH